jgi:hypothetical protein
MSQNGMSANFGERFGQMRKNAAFFQKYVFTTMNDNISIKMSCLRKSSDDNCLQKPHKSWENTYFSFNIFFGRFLAAFFQNRRPHGR